MQIILDLYGQSIRYPDLNANKTLIKGHRYAGINVSESLLKVNGSNILKKNINSVE